MRLVRSHAEVRPFTVALVHNYYQQPGGEDAAVAAEGRVLEAHGHRVIRYTLDNGSIVRMRRARLVRSTVWNDGAYSDLRQLFDADRPAVAHFHNTFPLVSPAAYYAARDAGVPVVQTLHNFRLVCPNALLYRDGHVCEECLGRSVPWPGVVHACYRDSHSASAVTAAMLATHHALGTWQKAVDVYIALTNFARDKFIQGGLPAERIVVKPNFVPVDPGAGSRGGRFALFVGRLSPEKGLGTLLAAWRALGGAFPLKIVGSGPLEATLDRTVPGTEWLGHQPKENVLALMREAAFLVLPSECYEGMPMTIVEAFASGLPVVTSGQGSLAEVVEHGRTGLHFTTGDPVALAAAVERAVAAPREMAEMGRAARGEFEAKYTAEEHYRQLCQIYAKVSGGEAHRMCPPAVRRVAFA